MFITKNTLDCDQSNVYPSRDIFSSVSPNVPIRSFSLYFRSSSDPLLWNKCPISYHMHQESLKILIMESEGKVWSVYIHNMKPNMCFKDMAVWIYKIAARYNRKWCQSIRHSRNPTLESNTKSIGRRIGEIWPFAACRHLVFDPTGINAIRSAIPKNPAPWL